MGVFDSRRSDDFGEPATTGIEKYYVANLSSDLAQRKPKSGTWATGPEEFWSMCTELLNWLELRLRFRALVSFLTVLFTLPWSPYFPTRGLRIFSPYLRNRLYSDINCRLPK